MDDDAADDPLPIGPQLPSYHQANFLSPYQPWSFPAFSASKRADGGEEDEAADLDGDADSMAAGNDVENESQRIIEDFGDDIIMQGDSAHQNSPIILQSTEVDHVGEHMDLDDVVRHVEDVADPEAVDIHVDSPPPPPTLYEKND
jgi:hypothetical protein